MAHNLGHCGNALHAALRANVADFERGEFLGYQAVVDGSEVVDYVEERNCPVCHCSIGRLLGIEDRLAAARTARGGLGDQDMIGCCKRALHPDPATGQIDEGSIVAFKTAIADEALLGRMAA